MIVDLPSDMGFWMMVMLRTNGLLKSRYSASAFCEYLVRLESFSTAWTMISGRGLLALLL